MQVLDASNSILDIGIFHVLSHVLIDGVLGVTHLLDYSAETSKLSAEVEYYCLLVLSTGANTWTDLFPGGPDETW